MTRMYLLLLAVGLAAVPSAAQPLKPLANRNVRFGMPGEAKADPDNKEAYLIERPQYVLSYNDKRKTANWACWQLAKKDIGKVARGAFAPDKGLPKDFAAIGSGVYTGSGFDRGHLVPSKDRSDTEADNDAVFLMTNVVPQSPKCNQGAWEKFERYCRELAEDGKELYIAAGPYGIGGTAGDGTRKITIGKHAPFVTVPASVWKVVLVLDRGTNPNRHSRAIAIWMPNDGTVDEYDWAKYRVPVAEVEKKTKLKFFPLVTEEVATALKDKADAVRVAPHKK
ncbi:DNA/RNA non-specific endonuclease [Gemmata sp. JC717]|uniref:DNA/RNA non-specific endonuclease n=1 Tax=Gemmata algarum TaxID=2975278 RepID=UPI0021BAD334|nr:DNA/RNA non-specific endonuclease [Gemmata algarum]MDY3556059.1 DNA/RNA non-specific endonuclease [Gemmata algarum]